MSAPILQLEEIDVEEMKKQILTEEFAARADEVFANRQAHDFIRRISGLLGHMERLHSSLHIMSSEKSEWRKTEASFDDMQKLVLLFYKDLDKDIYDRIVSVVAGPKTAKITYKNGGVPSKSVVSSMQKIFKAQNFNIENFVFYTADLLDPKVADSYRSFAGIVDLDKNGVKVPCRDIVLNVENTIFGYYTIAHEFAHISSQREFEMKRAKEDCVGEIESKFMGKLFNDYMLSWGFVSDEEHKLFDSKERKSFKANLEKIFQERDLLEVVKPPITLEKLTEAEETFRTDPKYARNYKLLMCRLVETVETKKSAEYIYRYVVGEMVATALYHDYQKDPVATMERYKAFLFSNADKSLPELLEVALGEEYMDKIMLAATRIVDDQTEENKQTLKTGKQ